MLSENQKRRNEMRDLRILYFLDLSYNFGGSGNLLVNYAAMMQNAGCVVKVIIPIDRKGEYDSEYDRRCKKFRLPCGYAFISTAAEMPYVNVWDTMDSVPGIEKCVTEFRPDIMHSVQVNTAVELVARKYGIPHLMSVFQVKKNTFFVNYMKVYPSYHHADSVMYSESWKTGLGISSRCIRQGYHVLDLERSVKNDSINLICAGVVYRIKNRLAEIQLTERLLDAGVEVQLDLWGKHTDTEYVSDCVSYIREHHLQKHVHMKGFTSNIEEEMRNADVLLSCSFEESFPTVIVEALQGRVAVIATPVGGIPEIIRDGVNGYLTKGMKQEDFSEAFERYLRDRETGKLQEVIKNATQTFEDHFSVRKITKKLMNYYAWICQDNRTGICADKITEKEFREIWTEFMWVCEAPWNAGVYSDDDREFYRTRIWWIYHVKKMLIRMGKGRTKKVYLWGAGYWGEKIRKLLGTFMPEVFISGFIDSHKRGKYLGIPIFSPGMLKPLEDIVLIANNENYAEIAEALEQMGFEKNKSYFSFFYY